MRGPAVVRRRDLQIVYDDEHDVLYGSFVGAGPSHGDEEDIPGVILERDKEDGLAGFVVFYARARVDREVIFQYLHRFGFGVDQEAFSAR